MKRYRSSLPPLDALIFFEAAARLNSFTASATELNVTQAAVSKRIRELETHLGTDLFRRQGRVLTLTNAGAALYRKTAMALEFLETACRSVGDRGDEIVRIAANNAVSHFWLSPRLRTYGLTDRPVAVEIRTSDRLSDIIDATNDLAVIYGYGDTPGWDCRELFPERLVPVASPAYLSTAGIGEFDSLDQLDENAAAGLVLLNIERLAPDWMNWPAWIEQSGLSNLDHARLFTCQSYAQSIGLAVEGAGIALGSRGLIEAELLSGALRTVGGSAVETGRGYYLAINATRRMTDGMRTLMRVLEEATTQP